MNKTYYYLRDQADSIIFKGLYDDRQKAIASSQWFANKHVVTILVCSGAEIIHVSIPN